MFKLGYEERFYDFLTDCVTEVERRIKRNKQRLDATNGSSSETPVFRLVDDSSKTVLGVRRSTATTITTIN